MFDVKLLSLRKPAVRLVGPSLGRQARSESQQPLFFETCRSIFMVLLQSSHSPVCSRSARPKYHVRDSIAICLLLVLCRLRSLFQGLGLLRHGLVAKEAAAAEKHAKEGTGVKTILGRSFLTKCRCRPSTVFTLFDE